MLRDSPSCMAAWQKRATVGLVTSGGLADSDEIISSPCYFRRLARGIRPGRNKLESVNRPVTIGGVLVRPGDVVVADGDGVVVVPRERAEEVAKASLPFLEIGPAAREFFTMSKLSMSNGKFTTKDPVLEPLSETMQLGERVYQALLGGIVGGRIESGQQLRPDTIAEQLDVSTTPVREGLHCLERDGLVVKSPYQGWFVREFTEREARELYQMRAALECFSVRLACERIAAEEIEWLREHQSVGEAALRDGDMDAYRIYNRDLHAAIMQAARNSYLSSVMGQLSLQSQMLMARTIRLVGRPSRAIEEHHELIERIEARRPKPAQQLMERHILSALDDILRTGFGPEAKAQKAGAEAKAPRR